MRIFFDLKGLSFPDCSGLGVLLSCMRRVRTGGKRQVLYSLQPKVRSWFIRNGVWPLLKPGMTHRPYD
ncbi:anti-sigma factor antagonist [Verrucomicrobia bacterium S94]|nr:anti-sigma factor antagonist [Verrucomicrobia bacterium S94]